MLSIKVTYFEVMNKVLFFYAFSCPLLWFIRKMVMEDSKKGVTVGYERMSGSLDLKEIAKGFSFPSLPLVNPTNVANFIPRLTLERIFMLLVRTLCTMK